MGQAYDCPEKIGFFWVPRWLARLFIDRRWWRSLAAFRVSGWNGQTPWTLLLLFSQRWSPFRPTAVVSWCRRLWILRPGTFCCHGLRFEVNRKWHRRQAGLRIVHSYHAFQSKQQRWSLGTYSGATFPIRCDRHSYSASAIVQGSRSSEIRSPWIAWRAWYMRWRWRRILS